MAAAAGAGATAVVARRCFCSLLFVTDGLAYDELWRSFDLRARRAFPRLKAAAIGAFDGALAAGRLASGRAYAQSSVVAGGCGGHGPLDPCAEAHR